MDMTLLTIGLACVIAAIVGGSLEAAGMKVPVIPSIRRQVLLGLVGLVLLGIVAWNNVDDDPVVTPTPVATNAGGNETATNTVPAEVQTLPSTEMSLTLSISSGPAGTKLTIDGSGFAPGETVVIRFHTDEVTRVKANGQGAFEDAQATVPEDWTFTGQFDFIATGQSSLRWATTPFRVT